MTTTTAAKHAATTVAVKKTTRIVDFDESFMALSNELAEVTLARAEAERREKEIKEIFKAEAGMNQEGETLVVRIAGVIRHKIGLRTKQTIDSKLLQEAYPEAFEAVKGESSYQVISGA